MEEAPAALEQALEEMGLAPGRWRRLTGGYHNDVFALSTPDGDVVAKHYVAGSTNPLFPQLPADEHRALRTLQGTGLAPEPVGFASGVEGRDLLVYRYVEGAMWSGGTGRVGATLARLHSLPPGDGWRTSAPTAGHAAVHARTIAALAPPSPARSRLEALIDDLPHGTPPARSALVHTDCGPGNLVDTGDRLVLIDWQCPALGDPVEDLANFASPAIQILYDHPPLVASDLEALVDAYGERHPEPADRFASSRWAFHARLAAYCLYRRHELAVTQPEVSERYHRALDAELDLLTHRESPR